MSKKKRAAALSYDPEKNGVPIMTAFGEGVVADNIIEKARSADVPVVTDAGLAGMLAKLSIGDEIPQELYDVVARVLIFISQVDSSYGKIKNR